MQNTELFRAIRALEKEKGIPADYMLERIEAALQAGVKKHYNCNNVRVVLDPDKNEIKVFRILTVVDPNAENMKEDTEPEKTETEKTEAGEGEEAADAEEADETAAEEPEEEKKPVIEIDDTDSMGILYDTDNIAEIEAKKLPRSKFNPALHITLEEAHRKNKRYKLGDSVEVEIKPKDDFGRMAAVAAKQVIIQGIREAEKGLIIKEYEDKKDELVTATVSRINPINGDAILEIGKNVVCLQKKEQIPGETFTEGEIIRVYVLEVNKDKEARGPAVVLSRTHPGLVKRLFELEVPEIQDGTVIIKSVSREAGSRTKIAVYSRDENVDAIGSCIGPKGIRKNNIAKEIGGEKIDIVKYSDIPEEFIKAALSPATVVSVTEVAPKSYRVLVDDDQLSLAIGKKGQNVSLAARLTGCKIDIKSAEQARAEALNDIIEGRAEANTLMGGKLAEALKKAREAEIDIDD